MLKMINMRRYSLSFYFLNQVLEDVQWALCGQLMGVVDFLQRFKASTSPAKIFCLRYNKFAVQTIGPYSMVCALCIINFMWYLPYNREC